MHMAENLSGTTIVAKLTAKKDEVDQSSGDHKKDDKTYYKGLDPDKVATFARRQYGKYNSPGTKISAHDAISEDIDTYSLQYERAKRGNRFGLPTCALIVTILGSITATFISTSMGSDHLKIILSIIQAAVGVAALIIKFVCDAVMETSLEVVASLTVVKNFIQKNPTTWFQEAPVQAAGLTPAQPAAPTATVASAPAPSAASVPISAPSAAAPAKVATAPPLPAGTGRNLGSSLPLNLAPHPANASTALPDPEAEAESEAEAVNFAS